jgi:histone H3/H4
VFCSVECWDAHVPMANHREAWAIENRSPKVYTPDDDEPVNAKADSNSASANISRKKEISEREKFISGLGETKTELDNERENNMTDGNNEKEILVVASKLKNYIRAKSGMNTSGAVIDVLSDKIRELCDQAVESAKRDGRKTVMDRDFTG